MLWVRALDETHAKLVPNTEGAGAPFWSPDSQYIGFFANQFLKKMRIADGSPQRPAAEHLPGRRTWRAAAHGTKMESSYSPQAYHRTFARFRQRRKAAAGDYASEAKFERSHLWPQFLPDGKHFIFFVLTDMGETSGVYSGAHSMAPSYTACSVRKPMQCMPPAPGPLHPRAAICCIFGMAA